jgi:hypothetical protein
MTLDIPTGAGGCGCGAPEVDGALIGSDEGLARIASPFLQTRWSDRPDKAANR